MGHAMHSMLARTRYQHVTGTRCSTDFAEVPSVLMESFALDPRVLKRFAKHYKTGQDLSEEFIEKLHMSRTMFTSLETTTQAFYAVVDQVYHGRHPLGKSTTAVLAQLQNEHFPIPYVDGRLLLHICLHEFFKQIIGREFALVPVHGISTPLD